METNIIKRIQKISNGKLHKSTPDLSQFADSKRKQKAIRLLENQISTEKKDQLQCLLEQHYIPKYGSKGGKSNINSTIRGLIRNFIYNNNDSAAALVAETGRLDTIIATEVSKLRKEISEKEKEKEKSNRANSSDNNMSKSTNQVSTLKLPNEITENQWMIISTVERIEEEERKRQEILQQKKKTEDFRKQLDVQRTEIEKRQEEEKRLKAKQTIETQREAKKFADEIEDKKIKKLRGFEVEREFRISQMAERQKLRDKEREERIQQEQSDIMRAKKQLELEEQLTLERKLHQKALHEATLQECKNAKLIKEEELRKHREIEKDMMLQYAAKLEAEEIRRVAVFQNRIDALNASVHLSETRGAGAIAREEEKKREELLRLAVEQKKREDEEKDRRKKEEASRMAIMASEQNRHMMYEKELNRAKEKQDGIESKMKLQVEILKAKEIEREELARRKRQQENTKKDLEEQITARRQQGKHTQDREDLSKTVLAKLSEDPELYKKVVEKINTTRLERSKSTF